MWSISYATYCLLSSYWTLTLFRKRLHLLGCLSPEKLLVISPIIPDGSVSTETPP